MSKVLTDIAIRNLKPGPVRREIPDGNGLYVVVQPSGKKSYAVRYRYGGAPRKLTLPGGLSLKAARKAAGDALYEVEKGRDPSAAKRHAKQEQRLAADNSFRAVAEEYIKREGGRLRTADDRRKVLERLVYRTLGNRPIADIRRSEIIRLLDKIEEGDLLNKDGDPIEGGPVMADRTLAVIRKIMNWHATRSDDFRSPIVRGMARVKAKERARERTLTDDELRAIWKTAEAGQEPFGHFLQFLLLTAARRTEASEMVRGELSGTDWTLPADRNKTKVDLIRPLSAAAQEVLARTPKLADCQFVFSTDGRSPISGFSRFKENFDKACGVTGWTLHDLRRTARSLMSRAGVNADHAERCLGHVIAGVRGTYDRHEYHAEKKTAYEALAGQIDRIVNPRENVASLPVRKARAPR
jgi:integrase